MQYIRTCIISLGVLFFATANSALASEPNVDFDVNMNAWNLLDPVPGGSMEFPKNDPNVPEIWLYTDKNSYAPGDEVIFYVHTTGKKFSYTITRDGGESIQVKEAKDLDGMMQKTPKNAYKDGAGWKESFRLKIPSNWRSGVYLVRAETEIAGKGMADAEHFFVVRSAKPGKQTNIALMLATTTYEAYNDWGGANMYRTGNQGVAQEKVSNQRPWPWGFSSLPDEAPRHGQFSKIKEFERPRYRHLEFAFTHGFSRHYADAGWAYYERGFARWAENDGYKIDYLTQQDLDLRPKIINAYDLIVIVGHDEYWTWEMRDHLDDFVNKGGKVARFAGNYLWQVRYEQDGQILVCYKGNIKADPLYGTKDERRVSTLWDSPIINRPSGLTIGLNGVSGVFNAHGGAVPRGSRGFTVYRPDHWAFAGTDLYYGDIFGDLPYAISAFEVDDVDYIIKNGLPEPTYLDGTPKSLVILALTPATKGEEVKASRPVNSPISDAKHLEALIDSEVEYMKSKNVSEPFKSSSFSSKYGAAAIGVMSKGKGEVFNAGASGWINGLRDGDFFTQQITRNVLNRYSKK